MTRLLALLLATTAAADPPRVHNASTSVTWQTPQGVQSVLRIVRDPGNPDGFLIIFDNENAHNGDNDRLELTFPGGNIALRMDWNVDRLGSETIAVLSVPQGWGCWPEQITVAEQRSGAIRVFPLQAGMM